MKRKPIIRFSFDKNFDIWSWATDLAFVLCMAGAIYLLFIAMSILGGG